MKILLVNSLFPPDIRGGAERSVDELRRKLEMQGHSVSVLALAIESSYSDRNVIRIKTRKMNPWSTESKSGLFSKIIWHLSDRTGLFNKYKIRRILSKIQPDIIHTNNLAGIGVGIWKIASRLDIPVIHTTRDYYLTCIRSSFFKNENNCYQQCLSCNIFSKKRKIYSNKYRPHLVGVSKFIVKHHSELGYFRKSIQTVIQNSPQIYKPSRSQRQLSIKGHEIFGYVGQLSPEKGINQLVEAFMESGSKNATLLILGEGKPAFSKILLEKCQHYPNIVFIGNLDINLVMPYIDVILIPSVWHEPLGRVLTESALFGIPVVYTPVGGMSEAVEVVEGSFYQLQDSTINSWKIFFSDINNDMLDLFKVKFSKETRKPDAADIYIQIYQNEVEEVKSYNVK